MLLLINASSETRTTNCSVCPTSHTSSSQHGTDLHRSMLASPSPTTSPSSAVQPPPTPSPLTLQPAIPSNFTMLDLEILHYWTTTSVNSFIDFPSCITLFRDVVPALAFSFPFLMEEILGQYPSSAKCSRGFIIRGLNTQSSLRPS